MALIYIVEDDASIREIETIALKNSNYIVRSFGCAADFYKKTDEILPDLVPIKELIISMMAVSNIILKI